MRKTDRISLLSITLAVTLSLSVLLGGCSLLSPKHEVRTPAESKLAEAVQADRVELAREGIEEGANIDEFQVTSVKHDSQKLTNPLWIAFTFASFDTASLLIESGANLNHYYSTRGETYLSHCINLNNTKLITLLLEHGADPNTPEKDGTTIIEVLFEDPIFTDSQLLEIINLMIGKGLVIDENAIAAARNMDGNEVLPVLSRSLVDADKKTGLTDIEEAAILGNSAEVQTLLQDGKQTNKNETDIAKLIAAYCDLTTLKMSIEQATVTLEIDAMFTAACRTGNLENVKYLLEEKDADINSPDSSRSPLISAIENNHTEVVKYLLDHNPEFELADSSLAANGFNHELASAVICGNLEILDMLVDAIGILSPSDISNAIQAAALCDREELITYFRDKGYSGDLLDANGLSVLVDVAGDGNADAVQLMIDYGANLEGNSVKRTPLIVACTYGNTETVRCLLENGAKPYRISMMNSVFGAKFDKVKLLVEYGADINAVSDDNESSVLGTAVLYSNTIFAYLIKQGGNVNYCNAKTGLSLLMLAAKFDVVDNARVLIEAGYNTSIRDNDGKSAYDYAVAAKDTDMLALFAEKGITE